MKRKTGFGNNAIPKRKGAHPNGILIFDKNVTQKWKRVNKFIEDCKDVIFWIDIKTHLRSLLKDIIGICMDQEMIEYTNAKNISFEKTLYFFDRSFLAFAMNKPDSLLFFLKYANTCSAS